jgi:hypothetical protein
MSWFWQKTQRREQPVKNTVPEPLVPLMHGSSPKWGAALAAVGREGLAHTPPGFSSPRSAPQRRGQSLQTKLIYLSVSVCAKCL